MAKDIKQIDKLIKRKVNELSIISKDSKEINPNLLNDVLNGLIKPSKVLDSAMDSFYADKNRKIRAGVKNSFRD